MAHTQPHARSRKKTVAMPTGTSTPDAIALLKQDHAKVKALFDQFKDAETNEKEELATTICKLLTIHATIEEEILYPAAKDAFEEEEDKDLVNEAEVEHESAKELISQIEDMSADDEQFAATVKVLSEQIAHHVKEEETELFAKLSTTDLDFEEMGVQLAERKDELMSELSIADDEVDED